VTSTSVELGGTDVHIFQYVNKTSPFSMQRMYKQLLCRQYDQQPPASGGTEWVDQERHHHIIAAKALKVSKASANVSARGSEQSGSNYATR
jgi:DNA primase